MMRNIVNFAHQALSLSENNHVPPAYYSAYPDVGHSVHAPVAVSIARGIPGEHLSKGDNRESPLRIVETLPVAAAFLDPVSKFDDNVEQELQLCKA